jgi:hypothetical protein
MKCGVIGGVHPIAQDDDFWPSFQAAKRDVPAGWCLRTERLHRSPDEAHRMADVHIHDRAGSGAGFADAARRLFAR